VLLGQDRGPHRDALLLGAGLVLDLTGRARGLRRGIEAARRALDGGEGARLLERLRAWQPGAA
jgi:anthranilate phosphoribosyltransferase